MNWFLIVVTVTNIHTSKYRSWEECWTMQSILNEALSVESFCMEADYFCNLELNSIH